MRRRLALALFAAAAMTASASAQLSPNWKGCTGNPDIDWKQQILRCTELIDSKEETQKNLSIAYYNRALAYENMNDYTHAIADYSQAAALDPTDAAALLYRGLDRIRAGDRAGGEADIAAARRIDPNIGH